jgi:hypothetical protein
MITTANATEHIDPATLRLGQKRHILYFEAFFCLAATEANLDAPRSAPSQ